ncbi:hypothetical protein Poli38472_012446 [Pythium oligandrum]|uniref:Uncharacterized protein n=1 Tax=Pythium oligandrum TaxID=41045 RepID=A0A8K1CPW5_PYTOL|nr:hypothetical protein Poli38472_012446 [Pythium oligandrum]|eukprot:TMW67330.1 hypothetical protein Poli38472_012446 [Pythium oligandrum]
MLVVTNSEFYGALAALKVATFCFGPVLSVLITVLVYEVYRGAIDGTIFGIVLRSVVVDLVFACGAQIVRDKFLKRIGVPTNDAWQVLSTITLFVSCSLAATTTHAKMDAGAEQGDFGPLDTIPPYGNSQES